MTIAATLNGKGQRFLIVVVAWRQPQALARLELWIISFHEMGPSYSRVGALLSEGCARV
jgi:hypothetical protein